MATKLDMLLESIDPAHTLDKVAGDVDRAVNSFSRRKAFITNWDEYVSFFGEFCRHIETVVLRMSPGSPNDKEFSWGQCARLIDKAFGPSGYKAAFEIVRTGKEGGLYRVLKTVADLMAEKYAQNEISARISRYWDSLTLDEKLAASDEYLRKYGHLLPGELIEASAARVRAHFLKVLEEHPKMIQRMRQIGR
jgi:hypothetical protein